MVTGGAVLQEDTNVSLWSNLLFQVKLQKYIFFVILYKLKT